MHYDERISHLQGPMNEPAVQLSPEREANHFVKRAIGEAGYECGDEAQFSNPKCETLAIDLSDPRGKGAGAIARGERASSVDNASGSGFPFRSRAVNFSFARDRG